MKEFLNEVSVDGLRMLVSTAEKILMERGAIAKTEAKERIKELEARNIDLNSRLDDDDKLLGAWKEAIDFFRCTLPKYPGLSSHAIVPVHEENNLWDRWKKVEEVYDNMVEK